MERAGNLYGTTFETESYGWGTVFELTPGSGGWSETVLHNSPAAATAVPLIANVVLNAQDNAYGTTSFGGTYRKSVIWEITP